MTTGYRILGNKPRILGEKLPNSHEHISQVTIDRESLVKHYRPKNVREFLRNNPKISISR